MSDDGDGALLAGEIHELVEQCDQRGGLPSEEVRRGARRARMALIAVREATPASRTAPGRRHFETLPLREATLPPGPRRGRPEEIRMWSRRRARSTMSRPWPACLTRRTAAVWATSGVTID